MIPMLFARSVKRHFLPLLLVFGLLGGLWCPEAFAQAYPNSRLGQTQTPLFGSSSYQTPAYQPPPQLGYPQQSNYAPPSYQQPPPPNYRQPANNGYYAPPAYVPPPSSKTSKPKTSKKTTPAPAPVSTSTTVSSRGLASQVAKLVSNDRRQDQRISALERKTGGRDSSIRDGSGRGGQVPYVRYTVRPGDNLWRIASKHKVSINDIRANNRITNDVVEIGEVLTIPNGNAGPSDLNYPRTPSRTPSYAYDQPSVRNSGVHIVRSGESLGAIAKSYGVSTASMASANRLNNPNSLLVGQRLTVPGSSRQINKSPVSKPRGYAPPPSRHEAVPLPYHTLAQRQEPAPPPPTYTPAPEPPPPSFPTFPTTPSPAPAPIKSPESSHRGVLAYRVVKGDNIDNVASLFGTTPQKLRDMNRMSGTGGLKEGDEIIVPAMSAVSVN